MPAGPDWTKAEIRRVVEALRDGARPAEVEQSTGRTWNAVKLALRRSGHPVAPLLTEGQLARVRRVLLAGSFTAEVSQAEDVTERRAQALITAASGHTDRRTLGRKYTDEQARRIYVSAREIGFTATARRFGMAPMSVWNVARRYREEVLPDSPPLRGFKGKRTDLSAKRERAPAGLPVPTEG